MPVNKRKDLISYAGAPQTVVGADIVVGQRAPDFIVQKNNFTLGKAFKETPRKVRIIASVPSLDTGVCDREARRFNEEAANLGKSVVVMIVSMDLPVAQTRWCGAAGVDRVLTFSDAAKADFGKKYGTLMEEVRLLRRAVFVVDKKRVVKYAAYMPANSNEPNYEEVLEAAKAALSR